MENELAYITSLIGDPVRTSILWSLLDGRAYTATELSLHANTSPQNMSMHLQKLLKANLLTVETQGRHKYYTFARPEVAYAIEAIGSLLPGSKESQSKLDQTDIQFCRTCYDHLAGKVGVLLTEALGAMALIKRTGNSYLITRQGEKFFAKMGVDMVELKRQRRNLARPCLDWSERKHHLAGALGAALLQEFLRLDYMRKTKHSRAVILTSKGSAQLYSWFRITV